MQIVSYQKTRLLLDYGTLKIVSFNKIAYLMQLEQQFNKMNKAVTGYFNKYF